MKRSHDLQTGTSWDIPLPNRRRATIILPNTGADEVVTLAHIELRLRLWREKLLEVRECRRAGLPNPSQE